MSSDILVIKDRKGTTKGQITLNLSSTLTTVEVLKKEISKLTRIAPIRQYLTIGDGQLSSYSSIVKGVEITVKDLGPQLGWRTVFYAEYFGPIVFFAAFYLIGSLKQPMSDDQNIGLLLGVLHYVKRILETLYIHIFSRDSMPLASCWKNFLHYWIFFGTFIGIEYFLYYQETGYSDCTKIAWISLWIVAEFLNFQCHLHLSTLRGSHTEKLEDGSSANKKRKIPHGWGFDQVSCANYLWETLAWIAFSGFSRLYASYFFTAVSFYQMFVWALGKQRRYKKEFGKEFPKNRKAIIPFII